MNVHVFWAKGMASGFDGRAADSRCLRVVLLLSASASAMAPSGPSVLPSMLRLRQREGETERVQQACMLWALKARAEGFDHRAADLSFFRVVLLLSASASAMAPSGPSSLKPSLRTR